MNEPVAEERVRRIVAAVDFSPASDRAVEWAAAIAARRRAELYLVHAVPFYVTTELPLAVTSMAADELLESARARLAESAQALRGRVRSVVSEAALGSAVPVVLEAVRHHGPELLVVGTRGLRGWQHVLLGSTAQRLLGTAPCPVLAVHEGDPAPPDRPFRLVAASDGSEDARNAVRCAARLFELAPAAVLMQGFQPPPVFYPGTDEQSTYDLIASARAGVMEKLVGEAATLAGEGIDVRPMVRDGYAPDEIVGAARTLPGDLLVLGSRGRGGIAHLLLGSTAERVVQRASTPVLVVSRRAAPVALEEKGALAIVGAAVG
ncbi:MAG TPA: universal stress protein [Thermoanaerobaculia bacterium]|jgi:nucleotide-binding universal stress UspA family protein|nr:universal stress protein [Thermoanaerobaculia bacterium]